MPSLLLGCGRNLAKQVFQKGNDKWPEPLHTIDMNADVKPTMLLDMDACAPVWYRQLPFDDNWLDEIGAYNTLEHWGQQGDWRGWFNEMGEYHRILKPGGLMSILVPIGDDALADPGHTRFFSQNHFGFLNQKFYERTDVTDYRFVWKKNFDILYMREHGGHHLAVILQKA